MSWDQYLPNDIAGLYEVYDFKHAAAILAKEFPAEFLEICGALRSFRFTTDDIIISGGNESHIPKIFSDILRPMGWNEKNMEAELHVYEVKGKTERELKSSVNHGSHKVDYLKGRVAFDLEWNSKDQTFDRDLYAFRAFFEYDAISVGVLVTRSNDLDFLFKQLGINSKYGASTTHMGKLIPRLQAGRNGGCPVLVFGITQKLVIK
ncbi:MAG: BglII/BstYI family type II restriction endonuclease [Prolixibacteraceae bacterium]|nr:BglII/BstYI family type II restriction endonuclease [Prolixibacteraceae bacterium]